MPRINIEDGLFKDNRFTELCILLGCRHKALGVVVGAWIIAQRWYLSPSRMVPLPEWEKQKIPSEIFACGLAKLEGDFVRVAGADEHFGWYAQRVEAGRMGGLKRQENFSSTAIANASKPKQTQPSSSSSSSSSKENTIHTSATPPAGEVGKFLDLWNVWSEQSGMVTCKGLSKKRAEAIKARLKENPDMTYWDSVMRIMANSKFLTGQTPPSAGRDKSFRADIDFMIRPDTHLRVLEGKYGSLTESQPKKVMLFDPELGMVESKQ